MSAKFFVFGGRCWRELDTDDGSLEGWGRARFVYYRRGRLHIAKRGAVLRALRALGAGCGVAARDSLPLSKCKPKPSLNNGQQNFHACQSCQAQYCVWCSNDAKFHCLLRPAVATANAEVQVTLATESQSQAKDDGRNRRPVTESKVSAGDESHNRRIPVTESKRAVDKVTSADRGTQTDRKRKRRSSSDSTKDCSATESKTSARDEGQNERRSLTESNPSVRDEGQNRLKPITESNPSVRDVGQNRLKPITESNPSVKDEGQNRLKPITESNPSVRDEGQNRLKPITESKPSVRDAGKNGRRPVTESKRVVYKVTSEDRGTQRDTKRKRRSSSDSAKDSSVTESKISVRDEDQNRRRSFTESRRVVDKVTSEDRGTQSSRKKKRRSSSDSAKDSSNEGRGGQEFKDLIIEESDVEMLTRFFLRDQNGLLDVDVDRFLAEDDYEERVFYAINPLVMVERCPRIARLLSDKRKHKRERDSDMALRQFMKVLGLKTVGEESPVKRYKTRASINHDKENAVNGYEAMTRVRSSVRPCLREDNASQREHQPKRAKPTQQKVVSEQVVEISRDDEFLASKASIR